MAGRSTLLKALLRARHWQKYATFCREYDKAADRLDGRLVGTWPSRSQFVRWLGGEMKGLPHPDHCRVLESMFDGLSAAQLFASAEQSLPRLDDFLPSGTTVTAATAVDPRPIAVPSVVEADGTGRGHGTGALGEEIAMATEDAARFVRRGRGAVDQDVLDQLNADVRQLAVDYLSRPPYAMIQPLSRLRREVFDRLEEHQRPKVLPPLYRAAGQLCALLAHASADLGQAYAAETDTRAAWLCADLAEDNPLRVYVRWIQSNVAYWSGDYRRAAELAHSAQRYATTGTSLLRLASQEARAYAACGEQSDVERALGTVEAARGNAEAGIDSGVFRFEPGKAAYYASEARLALGGRPNAMKAADDAQTALDLFTEAPPAEQCPEFIAAARLDLAASHLALGTLDGAAEHLEAVFGLATESRTQPIVGRISKTEAVLTGHRYGSSPLGRDMLEQIALFRAYTATRELPALPA